MGVLEDGASCREYLEGAVKRDDINWELKSAIRLILDDYDRIGIAFGCECEKSAKLLEENVRLHRQMHSSQPYYYDEWKKVTEAYSHLKDQMVLPSDKGEK
jgi:hypothetical protein